MGASSGFSANLFTYLPTKLFANPLAASLGDAFYITLRTYVLLKVRLRSGMIRDGFSTAAISLSQSCNRANRKETLQNNSLQESMGY